MLKKREVRKLKSKFLRFAAIFPAVLVSLIVASPVFAQTPTPDPSGSSGISLTSSISALTALGVLPVITLAAVVAIAGLLYARFRK
jgi:hypothetical protein